MFSAPWKSGEPNNANGKEDCVQMELEVSVWNDVNCASKKSWGKFFAICEFTI